MSTMCNHFGSRCFRHELATVAQSTGQVWVISGYSSVHILLFGTRVYSSRLACCGVMRGKNAVVNMCCMEGNVVIINSSP